MARRKHIVIDHPTDVTACQIDVLHGQWATVLRSDLEAVLAMGLWVYKTGRGAARSGQTVYVNRPSVMRDGRPYRQHLNLGAFILELHGHARPSDDHQPDHLNFDVLDNRPWNLEWLPRRANRLRQRRSGAVPSVALKQRAA